jgi:hypothetical protein
VNAHNNPNPQHLKLHSSNCPTISSGPGRDACTSRGFIKVCSDRLSALQRWAHELGGGLDRGCGCV